MTSLITTDEVLARYGKKMPGSLLCDGIQDIEQTLRRECFGADIWDYMASVLTDDGDAVLWSCDEVYPTGAFVRYNGSLYLSLTNGNTAEPCDGDYWQTQNKFTNDCANVFWDSYMKPIILGNIYHDALPKIAFRDGNAGPFVQATDSNNQRPPTMAEIGALQANEMRGVNRVISNMKAWLDDKPTGCAIPDLPVCKDGCNTRPAGTGHYIMM